MTDSPDIPSDQPALLRHIVPVFVGGVVILMLTIVTDNWLAARGLLPTADAVPTLGSLLLVTAYRGVFAIVGCHMAARLAPAGQPRIRYALALGGLLLVLNIVGATSNRGLFPIWYVLLNLALPIPWAIIGGGTAARVMANVD
jgi:hypothetical protein